MSTMITTDNPTGHDIEAEAHEVLDVLAKGGVAVIPLNDALIKLMSANLPLFEITFIRGLIVLGFMLVFSKGFTSMLRLPALKWAKTGVIPLTPRVRSPTPGLSTLITLAPQSRRKREHMGPAKTAEKSTTL